MDHRKVSARGGRMTKKKYGEMIVLADGRKVNKHYSEIGRRGGKAKLKMYGIDYFKKLSELGVAARKKKAESKKPLMQRIVDTIVTN